MLAKGVCVCVWGGGGGRGDSKQYGHCKLTLEKGDVCSRYLMQLDYESYDIT